MVQGQCHCGGVSITLPDLPKWVLQCGCSVCSKLGVLWAYYPDPQVSISGLTSTYICNKRVIAFHHCPGCGCTTHWQTLGADFGRMGVNARLLDDVELGAIELKVTAGPNPDIFSN